MGMGIGLNLYSQKIMAVQNPDSHVVGMKK